MKKFKTLFLLLAIAISNGLYAQTITFNDPLIPLESKSPEITRFSLNNNEYIFYKSLNLKAPLRVDLQLDSYDDEGIPVNSIMINKTMDPTEPNYFEGLFPVANQLIFFKMGYDLKSKTSNLFAYSMNRDGSYGEPTKLAAIKAAGMINSGSFDVITSPDTKKILVLSNLPHNKKLNEKIILTVFDEELNIVIQKEIELPYISSKHAINKVFINNNGNVFLLKKIYAKKGIPDREMIFTFSPELTIIKEEPLKIGNIGVISSYKWLFNSNGDLIIGGLYYDYKKVGINSEDPDGVFLAHCGINGNLEANFQIRHFNGSHETNQLIESADNSYYILVENVFLKKETVGDGTNPITNEIFTNTNAYIFKFDNNRQFAWEYMIKRDELKSVNDGAITNRVWMGIMPNNNIVIIYKDAWARHDGVKRDVIVPPVSMWKGNIIEVVNPVGKQLSKTLIRDQRFGGKTGSYYFIPQTGLVVDFKIQMIALNNNRTVSTVISF